MNLDIAITATKRPELLEIMLSSFKKNMNLSDDCRVIINIDPIGLDIPVSEELDVCQKYFTNVHHNISDSPNFTKALMWIWSQVRTDYFLNIEDDWELLMLVDLQKMIDIMGAVLDLVQLGLRADFSDKHSLYDDRGFFKSFTFTGGPSLMRKSYVETILKMLSNAKNVEKQLKNEDKFRSLGIFGQYTGCSKPVGLVHDNGRKWMKENTFRKNGKGDQFITWIR